MSATRMLATFVAQTRYADLPPGLVDECKIAVLDALAAAFVGSTLPWAQRVIELVQELGGKAEASLVNHSLGVSRSLVLHQTCRRRQLIAGWRT